MDPDGHATQDAAAEDEASISARMLRKRTKTGCLTCRKRRIKCGEERPVCKNCVKSKRHCEGYNQRVTFRPQTVDIRHLQNGATTFVFPAATMGMDLAPQESHYQAEQYQNTGPIRPRAAPLNITAIYPHYPTPYTAPPYQLPWHGGHPLENPNMRRPVMHQVLADQVAQGAMSTHAHSSALQPFPSSDAMPQAPAAFSLPPQPFGMEAASQAANMPATHGFAPDGTWHQQQHGQIRQASVSTANSIPSVRASSILSTPSVMTGSALPPTPRTAPLLPNSWSAAAFQQLGSFSNPQPFISQDGLTEDSPEQVYRVEHVSPHTILEQAAIEYQDDNYYDVDPEPLTDLTLSPMIKEEVVLEHIMKVGNLRLSQAPRVDGYSEGILDSYRPEQTANPLRNPATARVFSHFIQVTAITISAYTRKPLPIGTYKSRADVPFSEAGIWTHTMPMAALHDQGLLQAMLALSSLHIAKLTGASTTPSYKHYAYALKAVHHNVGNASKRHTVPTIAASVLLAVYELWCAEHVKWSSHLAGARQLLVETDFAGMHRFVRKLKTEKLVEKAKGYPTFKAAQAQGHLPQFLKTRARQYRDLERIPDIDAQVVSLLAGKVVNYDDFGRVLGDEGEVSEKHANLDIPRFEILKDLFWGYVKHDMIGSVVSGNPMLLNFSRWTDCPPRAPINAGPGIIYGAYDHLIMLCGRIADFSTRDRARKLRGMQLNGGSWRSPPGAFGPTGGSPSNASASRSSQAVGNTPSPQLPPYFGMAPPGPAASMPSQYWTTQLNPSPLLPEQEQMLDFATATQQAISEWDEIMRAVDAFVSMLGEYYQPQEPGHQTPPMTPFGPAITYKSLDVGCFWGYINFAYILAHRSHPYMPPYSHMAAAIAARTTQTYADMIGRIAAGVMPPLHGKPISPFVGAAMCDLCLPLFFTGVQLVHPQQRDWVITTLFDIERRCAYDTAGTIAHGCQTAWYKAGKAGRGPPYTHRYQTKAQDQRINGAWEKIDPRSEPDQADDTDRRFVQTKPTARLHWAMGILGEEEDK